jgi:hypothetical protein
MPFASLIKVLAGLHSLVSYDHRELALAAGVGLLLAAGAAAALWHRRLAAGARFALAWSDGLLLAVGALLCLYLVVPTGFAGGGFFSQRLQLQMVLLFVVWLADQEVGTNLRRWGAAAVVALAAGWTVLHGLAYARLDRLLVEYTSLAGQIEPGSTVLSLSFLGHSPQPTASGAVFKGRPFTHAAGYLAVERRLVDLGLYQADRGYFPVVYRDELNPYRHLTSDGELESPAGVDLLAYERTGGSVDYVVLWARREADAGEGGAARLLAQLASHYELVTVTAPAGLGELYRRRGAATAPGNAPGAVPPAR